MPKSVVAIEKYINNASASIIVVNNGEATTAGSKFILDTIKVSDAATSFDNTKARFCKHFSCLVTHQSYTNSIG